MLGLQSADTGTCLSQPKGQLGPPEKWHTQPAQQHLPVVSGRWRSRVSATSSLPREANACVHRRQQGRREQGRKQCTRKSWLSRLAQLHTEAP